MGILMPDTFYNSRINHVAQGSHMVTCRCSVVKKIPINPKSSQRYAQYLVGVSYPVQNPRTPIIPTFPAAWKLIHALTRLCSVPCTCWCMPEEAHLAEVAGPVQARCWPAPCCQASRECLSNGCVKQIRATGQPAPAAYNLLSARPPASTGVRKSQRDVTHSAASHRQQPRSLQEVEEALSQSTQHEHGSPRAG